ncbi:MAG TPA: ThiF family adenylyltransferase [Spirochaetota bacterium]|nr:ThiF family adenylyltransferase [Spirochaetota bacterium]
MADFDVVEETNLNRQFYFKDQVGRKKVDALKENLNRISSDAKIEIVDEKIDRTNVLDIFKELDVAIEAFDKKEIKTMFVEELIDKVSLIICASGISGDDLENVKTKIVAPNLFVVGDFFKDSFDYKTYSPKVVYIASIMADIALKKGGFYE